MIVGFALHNLFFGEQVYVLGIPKPLAPPPDSRCRGLSRWSPSNQIKETSMIKTEYKKVVAQPRAQPKRRNTASR